MQMLPFQRMWQIRFPRCMTGMPIPSCTWPRGTFGAYRAHFYTAFALPQFPSSAGASLQRRPKELPMKALELESLQICRFRPVEFLSLLSAAVASFSIICGKMSTLFEAPIDHDSQTRGSVAGCSMTIVWSACAAQTSLSSLFGLFPCVGASPRSGPPRNEMTAGQHFLSPTLDGISPAGWSSQPRHRADIAPTLVLHANTKHEYMAGAACGAKPAARLGAIVQ